MPIIFLHWFPTMVKTQYMFSLNKNAIIKLSYTAIFKLVGRSVARIIVEISSENLHLPLRRLFFINLKEKVKDAILPILSHLAYRLL